MEFVDLIWVGVTGAASIFGYIQSRRFVRSSQAVPQHSWQLRWCGCCRSSGPGRR
jgi:hypothetical protein